MSYYRRVAWAPQLDMTDEILGVGMPCVGIMDVYLEPVLPRPELLIVLSRS